MRTRARVFLLILGGVALVSGGYGILRLGSVPVGTSSVSVAPDGLSPPEARGSTAGTPGPVGGVDVVTPGAFAPQKSRSAELSLPDRKKLEVLDQVLSGKNDNDPRVDTELKDFSAAAKAALRERYQATPAEKRNERGTLVFLLGREIRDAGDLVFLGEVLSERQCLSLQDCARAPEAHGSEEEHFESINEVTANYPQLLALRALKARALVLREAMGTKGGSEHSLQDSILQTIRRAESSPNPRVAAEARDLREELSNEGQ